MKVQNGYAKTVVMRGMKFLHYVLTVALFIICWMNFYELPHRTQTIRRYDILICLAYMIISFLMLRIYGGYIAGYNRISDLLYAQGLAEFIALVIIYVLHFLAWFRLPSPIPLLVLFGAQFVINIAWSWAATRIYFKLHAPRKTVLVYGTESDRRRLTEVEEYHAKFKIVKEIENPSEQSEELYRMLDGAEAVFASGISADLQNAIAKYCIEHEIQGYIAPHVGDIILAGAPHIQSFSVPIMNIRRAEPMPEYLVLKRAFDIFVSLVAIVLLSPLILITTLLVKCYDGGPALYKQIRLTQNGREFKIYKFRSMHVDAEKDGVARLSTDNDDRITPVGKIIRACRLDELPQLFNILKGDMTIVGPRPERPEIAAQYEEVMPAFRLRLQVKAGLTGYAQIYGKYNTDPYDKLELDLIYINRMSVIEDLRLMFATVRILFLKDSTSGVAQDQVTALGTTETAKEEVPIAE